MLVFMLRSNIFNTYNDSHYTKKSNHTFTKKQGGVGTCIASHGHLSVNLGLTTTAEEASGNTINTQNRKNDKTKDRTQPRGLNEGV